MMPGHGSPLLVKAQASKDATMAHFIYENWSPGRLFLHYNGSYHSLKHEGIIWYLKRRNPALKVATIHAVSQQDLTQLESENKQLADFILVIDADMTPTYVTPSFKH